MPEINKEVGERVETPEKNTGEKNNFLPKDIFKNSFEEKKEEISGEKLSNNESKLPSFFEDNRVEKNNEEEKSETGERNGLTLEEKEKLKEETGWSDEIVDSISSVGEAEIYKKANLVEKEINGKKCLVRNDIDWEQKDERGRTNVERAEQGLSPKNKDGKVIELHHIGQKMTVH